MTQELTRQDGIVATIRLPPEAASAGVARRFVEQALAEIVRPAAIDVVVLLTSELVTNAIMHAGTPVEVLVRGLDSGVQVEVVDAGQQVPVVVDGAWRPSRGEGCASWRLSRRLGVSTVGEMARPSGFAARRDGPRGGRGPPARLALGTRLRPASGCDRRRLGRHRTGGHYCCGAYFRNRVKFVQMPGWMHRKANCPASPAQPRPGTGLDDDGWSRFHHVSARSNHSVRLAWIRWQVAARPDGR